MRAVAVIAVAVAVAVASVGWSTAFGQSQSTWTVTLLTQKTIDIGPAGRSSADVVIRKYRLTDSNGQPVGFGYEECRWFSTQLLRCDATYAPPRGTISLAGVVAGNGSPLAITGGTGAYFGKTGQAARNGRTLTFVFRD